MSADILPFPPRKGPSMPTTQSLARTTLEQLQESAALMEEIGEFLEPVIALAFVKIAAIARAALAVTRTPGVQDPNDPYPDC
jgi:hypothetical protein